MNLKVNSKKLSNIVLITLAALFSFVLGVFQLSNNQFFLGGESYLPYNTNDFLEKSTSLWNSWYGFGLPNIYFISSQYAILLRLINIFLDSSNVASVFLGLTFLSSFLSFYSLLSYLFPKNKIQFNIFGSFFYIFNPYFLSTITWFPAYPYFFIFLPLILKFSIKLINESKILQNSLKLFIIFFLSSPMSTNISLFGLSIFLAVAFYIFDFVYKRNFKHVLKISLLFFSIVLLANMFWIVPLSKIYISAYSEAVIYKSNFEQSSLFKTPLLSAFTLTEYYWFDKIDEFGKPYYSYSGYYGKFFTLISGILLLPTFFILKNKQRKKEEKYYFFFFIFLLIIGVFLTKGTAAPFGEIYKQLLEKVKIFGLYRASDLKFPILVSISLSAIISYSLGCLSIKNKKTHILISFIILLILGTPLYRRELISQRYKNNIPAYWQIYANEKNNENKNSRMLLLPQNNSPFDWYKWGYVGGWLTSQLTSKSSIGFTTGYGTSRQEKGFGMSELIYNQLSVETTNNDLETLFNNYGIDEILVRNDFSAENDSMSSLSFGKGNSDINQIIEVINKKINTKNSFGELSSYSVGKNGILTGDGLSFEKVSHSMYALKIDKMDENNIYFLDSYDDNWKLYKPSFKLAQLCFNQDVTEYNLYKEKNSENNDKKTFGCISNDKFKEIVYSFLLTFDNNKITQLNKTQLNNFANQWEINFDSDNEYYILVYDPQISFLVLHSITLISSIAAILMIFFKRKND